MFRPQILLCVAFSLPLAMGYVQMSLDSKSVKSPWKVNNENNSIKVDGTVPGGIYTDLQKGKILQGDLLYKFKDEEYRWVAKENWTYSLTFDVPKDILNHTAVNIVFHGIDTVADIFVNGKKIGSSNNMFVRYVLPVKEHLKDTNNVLQVKFKSPIYEAKRLSQMHPYKIPPNCPPAEQRGECHVNFLRKMQSSFSWDWGPAFPSVGIWKSVEIEAYNLAFIRDTTVIMTRYKGSWNIKAVSSIESAVKNLSYRLIGCVYLRDDAINGTVFESKTEGVAKTFEFSKGNYFEIEERFVDMWWPNGYGSQKMYRMVITLTADDEETLMYEKFEKEVYFGFRTIELVEDEIKPKADGYTFYFKVNGVPIFAKGSNWIPAHVLPELGSDEATLRHTLQSAKEANMNMLRVWGGGVYESDLFYKLADELGLLIWQDMMFAVAMYPTDDKFLASVQTEARQQVRRLHRHPCIAIWGGNNENELALRDNWFNTKDNFELYKKDYIKLYVDTIETTVYKIDGRMYYVPSSPSNALRTTEEDYVAMEPNSPLYGDTHYYNYIDDPWNASKCANTRFASEYGFQSMPSLLTLSTVSKPEDWKLNSSFCQSRQHHRNGYKEMMHLMKYNLPELVDDGSETFFKNFIYYSQISQAMAVKTQTEKYRRDMGRLTHNREKYTMGALYWQLNDVWQAPTWSSIEFGGRWKMVHYYAKKFFAPILLSAESAVGNKDIEFYVVSDHLYNLMDADFIVSVYSWDSFSPKVVEVNFNLTVEGEKSQILRAYKDVDERLKSVQCTRNTCFLHIALHHNNVYTENTVFLTPFSKVTNLRPAKITMEVKASEDKRTIYVELKSDRIAPFVWLETEVKGQFSDNGFVLLRERSTVSFRNRGEVIDVDRFRKTLTVRSLLS